MLGQHIASIGFAHFRRQDRLGDGVADGVGGGVPTIIGGDSVEEVVFLEQVHQCIIRTIGEIYIYHGNGDASIDDGFHSGHEIGGAWLYHAVVAELSRFAGGSKGGIDGQHDVRTVLLAHDAADGCDMLSDGLSDGLAFVAWHRVFGAAQGVDGSKGGLQMIRIIVVAGDEEKRQLVGAGEGAVDFGRKFLAVFSQVPRFHGGLGVFAIVIVALAEIGEDAILCILQ